jgi:hypothetical protein
MRTWMIRRGKECPVCGAPDAACTGQSEPGRIVMPAPRWTGSRRPKQEQKNDDQPSLSSGAATIGRHTRRRHRSAPDEGVPRLGVAGYGSTGCTRGEAESDKN